MRAKLFWKLSLTYLALLLGAILVVDWYAEQAVRQDFIRSAEEQLAASAELLKKQPPDFQNSPNLKQWAAGLAQSGTRVTIIDARGVVLAETAHDPESMDNHLARPEIRQALATGEGQSVRYSQTLDRDLAYHAIRYDTPAGSFVVRLALPLAEVDDAVAQIRKRILLVSLSIIALGAIASILFSQDSSAVSHGSRIFPRALPGAISGRLRWRTRTTNSRAWLLL